MLDDIEFLKAAGFNSFPKDTDGFLRMFKALKEKGTPGGMALGNATGEDCASYCVTLFSDLTRYVTMQNLFHDGGFSFTGVTQSVIEKMGD